MKAIHVRCLAAAGCAIVALGGGCGAQLSRRFEGVSASGRLIRLVECRTSLGRMTRSHELSIIWYPGPEDRHPKTGFTISPSGVAVLVRRYRSDMDFEVRGQDDRVWLVSPAGGATICSIDLGRWHPNPAGCKQPPWADPAGGAALANTLPAERTAGEW